MTWLRHPMPYGAPSEPLEGLDPLAGVPVVRAPSSTAGADQLLAFGALLGYALLDEGARHRVNALYQAACAAYLRRYPNPVST